MGKHRLLPANLFLKGRPKLPSHWECRQKLQVPGIFLVTEADEIWLVMIICSLQVKCSIS